MNDEAIAVWKRIGIDLGIRVVAPFDLELASGETIRGAVLVRDFGARNGMLVVDDYEKIRAYCEDILDSGYGYSFFDPRESSGAYYREGIIRALADWSWTGREEAPPSWLSERDSTG